MYVQFFDEILLSSAGEVTGCIMSNRQVRQFRHHSRNGCLEVTLYNDSCVEGKFCGYFLHGYLNLCLKRCLSILMFTAGTCLSHVKMQQIVLR